MGMLYVLDHTGDTRIGWDVNNAASVAEARRMFNELRGHNYVVYKKTGDGTGAQIRDFDPTAEEIVMSPPLVGG